MTGKIDKKALIKRYSGRQTTEDPKPQSGPRFHSSPFGRNVGAAPSKPQKAGTSIKRLLFYMKGERYKLILVFFCLAIHTGSMLAGSYILRPIINGLMNTSVPVSVRIHNLTIGLGTMCFIYLSGVFANYAQLRITLYISQNTLQKIRSDLFQKMQKLPIRFFDTNNNGKLMSHFTNDIDAIGEMLSNTLVNLSSSFITVTGILALMFYTNWILAILMILTIPALTKAGAMIASRSRRYYKGQQEALGAINSYIEEMITSQKVIKVFCREEKVAEEFAVLSNHLQKQQVNAQFFGGIMGPVIGNLSQIIYSIITAVGGIMCLAGKFDIGGLTVFANYCRQFSRPLNEISLQVNTILSALAGSERVFKIIDELPESDEGTLSSITGSPEGYVKLNNITFGYHPGKTVLKNVSCYAKPGQKIAFVGSTGAGKTTITNLINRFYDIDEGQITIDGIDIKDMKKDYLRNNIAMVLQDTHLFTGTIMENIRYGRLDATDEEIVAAAKIASAHHFIKRLENGYHTLIVGDGNNLSQGQRQLLNIARAALSKAPSLILDEATSSVDTRTEKHIEHGMDRLMAEKTTFVIAHRLSTVRNSNAIMVLEQGEIIERGTHEELLTMKGRYYELYTGLAKLN